MKWCKFVWLILLSINIVKATDVVIRKTVTVTTYTAPRTSVVTPGCGFSNEQLTSYIKRAEAAVSSSISTSSSTSTSIVSSSTTETSSSSEASYLGTSSTISGALLSASSVTPLHMSPATVTVETSKLSSATSTSVFLSTEAKILSSLVSSVESTAKISLTSISSAQTTLPSPLIKTSSTAYISSELVSKNVEQSKTQTASSLHSHSSALTRSIITTITTKEKIASTSILPTTVCSDKFCTTLSITTGVAIVTSSVNGKVTTTNAFVPLKSSVTAVLIGNGTSKTITSTISSSIQAAKNLTAVSSHGSSKTIIDSTAFDPITTTSNFTTYDTLHKSNISNVYNSSVASPISTGTVIISAFSSLAVTVTSCSENSCSTRAVTTGIAYVTKTESGIIKSYTTYCPLTSTNYRTGKKVTTLPSDANFYSTSIATSVTSTTTTTYSTYTVPYFTSGDNAVAAAQEESTELSQEGIVQSGTQETSAKAYDTVATNTATEQDGVANKIALGFSSFSTSTPSNVYSTESTLAKSLSSNYATVTIAPSSAHAYANAEYSDTQTTEAHLSSSPFFSNISTAVYVQNINYTSPYTSNNLSSSSDQYQPDKFYSLPSGIITQFNSGLPARKNMSMLSALLGMLLVLIM